MKRILAVWLGTTLAVLIFAIAEWGAGVAWRHSGDPNRHQMGKSGNTYIPPDFSLPLGNGPLQLPKESYREISRRVDDGSLIFDVTNGIDPFRRRLTPTEKSKKNPKRFLALFGDSFVFGEGVPDDQTLASHLGRELADVRVYNYGIPGGSPGEFWDWARHVQGAPEITEAKGTVLYFLADYLWSREIGTLQYVGRWGSFRPWYHENERGEIVAEGTFKETHPIWTFLARHFVRYNLVKYFGLDWPTHPSDTDIRFEAKLIEQTREETRKFGADRFYVVFYPKNSRVTAQMMIPHLERANISYIDLSHWSLVEHAQGPAYIPVDRHPTGEGHRAVAEKLSQELSKLQ